MKETVIETDVLVIGGGIAGMMAAIRASELGAKVVVAEKGNALASGAGRCGNDHFQCYIPEAHGNNPSTFVNKLQNYRGQIRDKKVVQVWAEKSLDIIKLWDSWGIPMRYNDHWEFAGHAYPGSQPYHLKYSGKNQKPTLVKEALKRGATIINRLMVLDLLKNGNNEVIGAMGIGSREAILYVIKAKATILSTGFIVRLYPSPVLGRVFSGNFPLSVTGDGRAMALRAGAELAGLDMPYKHCGPKYFARSGQGTWVGVMKDASGKVIGPFVTSPDKRYGDPVLERYPTLFEDYAASGKGPVYMDCTGISEEDYDYMRYFMHHEGYDSFLKYLDEEGIDLRKNPVEFMRYEIRINGGIYYNEKAETSLKGLYAAGDEYFGGIANAAIFGWVGGENAALYANSKTFKSASFDGYIEEKKALLNAIGERTGGADWREINFALEQLMTDYAGSIRSESLLDAGLIYIERLKNKARDSLAASNQWELVRALEVLNLLDLGQAVMTSARERRETRGGHLRRDYPVTNPQLDRSRLHIKMVGDKLVANWREV